jgi:uncharacterized protein (DUF2236 family)
MRARPTLPLSHLVNGERLVLLGWSRAILLQLAHPLIAAGVYEHSGFRKSPLAAVQRLHGTTRAMLAIVFGSDDARERAIGGVRAIHRRVHGTLEHGVGPFPAGTPYSAEDPALLLWVHTTLIESTVLTYERFIGALSNSERDDYCAASASLPVALGAHPSEVPTSWDQLVALNAAMIAMPAITVGAQARELATALLRGPVMRALPPAAWLNRLVTIGQLPEAIRSGYGFEWSPRRARTLDRVASATRATRRVTPAFMARFSQAR